MAVFEPFGQVIAETSNPTEESAQLFTGQKLDTRSGLYDFKARWYDPEAGVFLSVDPVVADARDPQSYNLNGDGVAFLPFRVMRTRTRHRENAKRQGQHNPQQPRALVPAPHRTRDRNASA
jgi:RHS repeat-associated protein